MKSGFIIIRYVNNATHKVLMTLIKTGSVYHSPVLISL